MFFKFILQYIHTIIVMLNFFEVVRVQLFNSSVVSKINGSVMFKGVINIFMHK